MNNHEQAMKVKVGSSYYNIMAAVALIIYFPRLWCDWVDYQADDRRSVAHALSDFAISFLLTTLEAAWYL